MKNKLKILPKNQELKSLNEELYSEMSIEELEKRLETKSWMCGVDLDCPNLVCGVNTPTLE